MGGLSHGSGLVPERDDDAAESRAEVTTNLGMEREGGAAEPDSDAVLVLCRRIVQAFADAGLIDEAHVVVRSALIPLRVTDSQRDDAGGRRLP